MTLTLGMEKRMKGWPGEPQMEYDVLMADGNAAANAGRQITDVIFDFGNVLIYWDPAAVMTPRYSDGLVEQFLDNDVSGFYDINNELDAGMSRSAAPVLHGSAARTATPRASIRSTCPHRRRCRTHTNWSTRRGWPRHGIRIVPDSPRAHAAPRRAWR